MCFSDVVLSSAAADVVLSSSGDCSLPFSVDKGASSTCTVKDASMIAASISLCVLCLLLGSCSCIDLHVHKLMGEEDLVEGSE